MTNLPILIIDDEPSEVEGLKEFLQDEGYEVHHAVEVHEGLDIFRHVHPSFVISDLKMPGTSGLDIVSEIRKLDKDVPVIIISGYGSLDPAIDAIHPDNFDFIRKPIDLDQLKKALDHARHCARAVKVNGEGMASLRNELRTLQAKWHDERMKISEMEPLAQTGKLLSAVLHNLNNPLCYIIVQSDLLQSLHPDIQSLKVIKDQAVRIQKIISTIVNRVKNSQVRKSELLQINEVLSDEVSFLKWDPYLKTNIKEEWNLEPNLPLFEGVVADLIQIFGNLLRNAAEAMDSQDDRRLWIKTWHDVDGFHVSIKDNGPGIPEPLQECIFYPFFSTKSADTGAKRSVGMGIGLYHCRELVHQYGGEVRVQSKPGEGATFSIHLPDSMRKTRRGCGE